MTKPERNPGKLEARKSRPGFFCPYAKKNTGAELAKTQTRAKPRKTPDPISQRTASRQSALRTRAPANRSRPAANPGMGPSRPPPQSRGIRGPLVF